MDPASLLTVYPLNSVKVAIVLLSDPCHPIATWAVIDLSSPKSLIDQNIFPRGETVNIGIQLNDGGSFTLTAQRAPLAGRTVPFIHDKEEEFENRAGMHLVPGLLIGSEDMLRLANPLTVNYNRRESKINQWEINGLGLIFCSQQAHMKLLEKKVIATCEKRLATFLKAEELGLVEFSLYSQWSFTDENSILVIQEIAHRPDTKKIDVVRAIVATVDPFGYSLPFRLDYKEFLAQVLAQATKWNHPVPWKQGLIGSSLRIDDIQRRFNKNAFNTVHFFFWEDDEKCIVVAYNKMENGSKTEISFLLAKYLSLEDRMTFDYLPHFLKKALDIYILSFTVWKCSEQSIEGRLLSLYESALSTTVPVTIRLVADENNPAFFGIGSLYHNYRLKQKIHTKQISLWFDGPEFLRNEVIVDSQSVARPRREKRMFISSL